MTTRTLKILAAPYLELSEANPYQLLLYQSMKEGNVQVSAFSARKLLQGRWDVWHLHWPETIVNPKYSRDIIPLLMKFWIKLKVARFKRTKIFWTVHNLRSHEHTHPLLERFFWRIFLPNVDGVICLSELGKQQLRIQYPRARSIPTFVIPHGHYRGAYPDVINEDEARRALGIRSDKFVITFFGQLRQYIGVVPLIRCFARAQVANVQLLIAGEPINNVIMREIKEAAVLDRNVRLIPEFVDRNDMQKLLRASNLVVLPYKTVLNSGSAILALSFDRPVLAPALGALVELGQAVGQDWLRLYEGELSPDILCGAIDWVKARQIGADARVPLEQMNWDGIAESTMRAFHFVRGQPIKGDDLRPGRL